jgi:hypothetical protein
MKKRALRALGALALLPVLAGFLTSCPEMLYKPTVTLGIEFADSATDVIIPEPITYNTTKPYKLKIQVDAPPAVEVEVKLELSTIEYLDFDFSSDKSDLGSRVIDSQQNYIDVTKAQGGFFLHLKTKKTGTETTTITLTANTGQTISKTVGP